MTKKIELKSIPLSLKIVLVLTILWMLGSVFAIPIRFESGLPFFGLFITGSLAAIVLILLDIIGPIVFLAGVWTRKKYGFYAAIIYISIFILNSLVALITVSEQLGIMPILMPAIVYTIFGIFIGKHKEYFK